MFPYPDYDSSRYYDLEEDIDGVTITKFKDPIKILKYIKNYLIGIPTTILIIDLVIKSKYLKKYKKLPTIALYIYLIYYLYSYYYKHYLPIGAYAWVVYNRNDNKEPIGKGYNSRLKKDINSIVSSWSWIHLSCFILFLFGMLTKKYEILVIMLCFRIIYQSLDIGWWTKGPQIVFMCTLLIRITTNYTGVLCILIPIIMYFLIELLKNVVAPMLGPPFGCKNIKYAQFIKCWEPIYNKDKKETK